MLGTLSANRSCGDRRLSYDAVPLHVGRERARGHHASKYRFFISWHKVAKVIFCEVCIEVTCLRPRPRNALSYAHIFIAIFAIINALNSFLFRHPDLRRDDE